jgi:tetratricopeptide (TPR) repeat protein
MSEIYVYLVSQMHTVLYEMFQQTGMPSNNQNSEEIEKLKELADVAEWNQKPELALKYHKERISIYEENVNVWFDFCAACMRFGMIDIGEEGIKEIISRKPRHLNSLLAHAMNCMSHEKYEEAHIFLKEALGLDPKSVYVHGITGVYHDLLGEENLAETMYEETKKLGSEAGSPRVFTTLAQFAINLNNTVAADKLLAQDLVYQGLDTKPYLLLCQLELQRKNFSKAEKVLNDALKHNAMDCAIWNVIGHVQFVQKNLIESRIAYENALSYYSVDCDVEVHLIYIRLGLIALEIGCRHSKDHVQVRIAKAMFLKACQVKPTCESWLGVGKACFQLQEYDEAEDALSEANILNNRDSEVWLHLALVSLAIGRKVEAKRTLAQSLRIGVMDFSLLRYHSFTRIAALAFMNSREFSAAIELFRVYLEGHSNDQEAKEYFALCVEQELPALPLNSNND